MKTLREYIDLIETASLTEWAPTPEQEKWLGGANQQDPYILNRMPGAKPPITWFKDPQDQALAKRLGFPASEPAVATPTPAPAEPAAVATPVAEPTKIEPTPLPPAQQQAARPTPATPAPADSKVLALQKKLNALGAGLNADGVMGPKTKAAMEKYGLDADGNSTAKNVAAPGQPPATLAKDTNINQAQTQAAAAAIKKGQANPDSLYGKTTIAQPTGAIAPSNVNSGSGVGKDFKIDPALAASVADNASAYDKAWLAQQSGGKPQAFAGPGTAGNVEPRPANMRSKAAADWMKQYGATHDPATGKRLQEGSGYNELDRIVSLVHYR